MPNFFPCSHALLLFEKLEMSMTSESEEWMNSKNGVDSPSIDEISSGGSLGANGLLKKGPWTSAEDAILVEYVTKHGEGNWNAVQKHSGLARCGKSCRLRWANHLRPDLKKGAFSPEEERHIIELHAKMGNKWARMAAELPGRTDNEIKNYWNTRIKRRQRAGLPIYPPDVCLQVLNENQQNEQMASFSSGDVHHSDFLPINNFDFAAVEFKAMEYNQLLYSPELDIPASTLLDVPASSLLMQDVNSPYFDKILLSTIYPSKRFRSSESFLPLPKANQHQSDDHVQISQSFGFPSAYDPNPTPDYTSSGALPGSHTMINGNASSSEPAWAMKLELPSLQNQMGSWGSSSSPLPSLESVDSLMQTLPIEHVHSCNTSDRNSGLLDAVLFQSQSMKNSKNIYFQQKPHDSVLPVDAVNLHETEWETFAEPISPLCHSSSSMFSECTPISGSSFDELQSLDNISVKEEAADDLHLMKYDDRIEATNKMILSRPDFLLASNIFMSKKDPMNENYLLKDAMGTFFCDDLSKDCKQMDTAAAAASSTQGHGHGHGPDSCAWNAMPTI